MLLTKFSMYKGALMSRWRSHERVLFLVYGFDLRKVVSVHPSDKNEWSVRKSAETPPPSLERICEVG